MGFNVVCTLIDNDTRHHGGKKLLWPRLRLVRHNVLTTVITRIVVDKSTGSWAFSGRFHIYNNLTCIGLHSSKLLTYPDSLNFLALSKAFVNMN